jgi:hypothetical protein
MLADIYYYWAMLKNALIIDSARLMQADMIVRLNIQVLLLVGSAFFSCSETAMFSLSRLDLQKLRTEHNRHSETIHGLLDQPRRLIISILCGNELINIAAAANMTGILVRLYDVERAGLISTLIMVPLLLLFGEVTPKTIAVSNPVRISYQCCGCADECVGQNHYPLALGHPGHRRSNYHPDRGRRKDGGEHPSNG